MGLSEVIEQLGDQKEDDRYQKHHGTTKYVARIGEVHKTKLPMRWKCSSN